MNHTTLLNHLIAKYNLKSYCEIGIKNPASNYNKINCQDKEGCDPNPEAKAVGIFTLTSDQYFNHFPEYIHKDLFFIDGLHHADQVERDFNNSLKCLNDGGFIVLHDTCPDEEQYTTVPRQTKRWFGDVFSFAMNLGRYTGLNFLTIDEDCGITVCWKLREVKIPEKIYVNTFDNYKKYKKANLQVISNASELDKYLPKVKEISR